MEEHKVDELIEKFDRYMSTINNNESESKKFLQDVGILDEDGNLEEPYKDLCTHQERD